MKHSLRRFDADTELARTAAAEWIESIQARVAAGRRFSVALSGGRVPQALFKEAVAQSADREIPWHAVDFFWADERCVAPDHADSNFRVADELLLKPLRIPAHNIFRLCGELPQHEAVRLANCQVHENVPAGSGVLPELDLVFLGMGEDGHTASLFPNAGPAVMECTEPFLAISDSPKPPPERITMSYALLVAAKEVRVLIAGPGKEQALADVLSDNTKLPLGRLMQMRAHTQVLQA